jgi:hypothetical protein
VSDPSLTQKREKRLRRIALAVGAVIGLVCHFLPPDYRDACSAVVKAVSMTCGGI